MANSLAELEVFGLERLLDLRLPVPRRVLLLLLLLRGRGRACGQAVQHLPDVEFPHGLAQGSPRCEAQVGEEAPAAKESEPLKPSGGFDRGERRSSGEQKIIPTGRAATTGGRARGGEPSSSEAAAAAVAPDAASSPGRGRAPAVPRRCRRPRPPRSARGTLASRPLALRPRCFRGLPLRPSLPPLRPPLQPLPHPLASTGARTRPPRTSACTAAARPPCWTWTLTW